MSAFKTLIPSVLSIILAQAINSSSVYGLCIGLGCSCSVSTTGLNFGNYNPKNVTALSMTTNLQVSCTALAINTQIGYTITFGTGQSGNYTMRYMSNGISYLNYNLFKDSNATQIIGNGSSNTSTFTANYIILQLLAPYVNSYSIYGKIYPSQNVTPGSYTDSIIVTVNF